MKKLFIINNELFKQDDVAPDSLTVNYLTKFVGSITELIKSEFTNYEIVYVNNNAVGELGEFKEKFEKICKVVEKFEEISLIGYDVIMVSNSPFISIDMKPLEEEIDNIKENDVLYTYEGWNLYFKGFDGERELFSRAKVGEKCGLPFILFYMFKTETLTNLSQKELIKNLNNKYSIVFPEYVNTLLMNPITLFDNISEYIEYCGATNNETFGRYVINANDTPTDLVIDYVKKILANNPEIQLIIKSQNIQDIINEQIEINSDNVTVTTNNFGDDLERIDYKGSSDVVYNETYVNYVIDLSNLHKRHYFIKSPKYMKRYNHSDFMYKITKDDLDNAKRIAVKRTMGMGDTLLVMPIIKLLHDKYPNLHIDLFSTFNPIEYLETPEIISEFHKINSTYIFKDINTDGYDLVLDFDLGYENKISFNIKESYYDCYLSFFEDDAIDKSNRKLKLLKTDSEVSSVILVNEASGWRGREYSMDIADSIALELKNKNFLIVEPGINRISNYADVVNEKCDLNKVFNFCSKAKFYVGTDSGIAHIMNLMGNPSFIFGGMVDPLTTMYNTDLVTVYGKKELHCYGCKNIQKGNRLLSNGQMSFVPYCFNSDKYECMNFETCDVITELNNFLLKNEF